MSLFWSMTYARADTDTPSWPPIPEQPGEKAWAELVPEEQSPLEQQDAWFAAHFGPLAVHEADDVDLPDLPVDLPPQTKSELAKLLRLHARLLRAIDFEIGGGSAQARRAIFKIQARLEELSPPASTPDTVLSKLGRLFISPNPTPQHARSNSHAYTPRHQR